MSGFLAGFPLKRFWDYGKTSTYIYIEKLNETTSEISVAIWNSHQLDPKNVSGSQSLLECPWQSSAFPGGKIMALGCPRDQISRTGTLELHPQSREFSLVGGAITILKNDGVVSWEGLSHIIIVENKTCSKPPTSNFHHVSSAVAFHVSVSSNAGIAKENLGSPFTCTSVL